MVTVRGREETSIRPRMIVGFRRIETTVRARPMLSRRMLRHWHGTRVRYLKQFFVGDAIEGIGYGSGIEVFVCIVLAVGCSSSSCSVGYSVRCAKEQ